MKIVINISNDEAREAIAERVQRLMGVPVRGDDVEVRTYEGFRITVDQWPPKRLEPIPAPPVNALSYDAMKELTAQAVPAGGLVGDQGLNELLEKMQAQAAAENRIADVTPDDDKPF